MHPPSLIAFLAQASAAGEAAGSAIAWSDISAILPPLVLFATGATVLLLDCLTRPLSGTAQDTRNSEPSLVVSAMHFIALLGTGFAGALASATLAEGGTELSFGGAARTDAFTGAVSVLVAGGTFLTLLAAVDYLRRLGIEHGEFHCLVLFAAGAMMLFVQSNNLIMAFLSLETLSMAAYVLAAFLRDSRRSLEGGLKYFILGGFSTGFLLLGFTLLYGATRQIEFPAMASAVATGTADIPLLLTGLALSVVGLGFKVGAFPFHSWVPDAYEGAPAVATGFMAVTVKAAAFGVLLRLLIEVGNGGDALVGSALQWIVAALALATMVYGNVVALLQESVKRMLAYSAIGHTGYLLVGVAAALSPGSEGMASAAVLFYLVPYSLMTLAAFTLLGYLGRAGEDRESFEDYRGLSTERPWVALGLLVVLVSFAGIPPTAGFWAKLHLFRAAIASGHWPLALAGVLTSIISLYFYLRLVVNFYMRPAEGAAGTAEADGRLASGLVIGVAAAGVVVLGIFPDIIVRFADLPSRVLGG